MKITIKDIALAANVAKSTVSKVLNNSPKISEETKDRVRQIIKDMNYTPSSTAIRLAKKNTYNIGLLIDMSQEQAYLNPFFYNIMVGIESVIGPLNYELTIANIQPADADPERHYMKRLVLNKRIDGLITNNSILTDEIAAKLNELAFPFVSMGEYEGESITWVDFDNELGGRMLTEHLLSQGYEKIAFVGGEQGEKLFTKRYQGYTQILQEANMSLREEWVACGVADEDFGYEQITKLLQMNDPPDSIICMNNNVAFGALKAAKEFGVHVPETFGIATFDDYPYSPYISPSLTSLYIKTFELGEWAGKMLISRIENTEFPHQSHLLKPVLIVRESTTRIPV